MVSVDSRRVSRAPRYSGVRFESRSLSPTRLSRSMASLSSEVRLMTGLVTLLLRILQPPTHLIHCRSLTKSISFSLHVSRCSFLVFRETRNRKRETDSLLFRQSIRCIGFGLFRVRSPLLSESRFLSFPSGTEMVHFPEFAPPYL
jgi:hypothetical protein